MYYIAPMKTLTVRLPEALAANIEAESRRRRVSKSDVIRERLEGGAASARPAASFEAIADLVGSVEGGPPDLSDRKKHYLQAWGYGRNRSPR